MLIKKMGVVAVALSTLITAAAANAAVVGPYLGGQLGWGNNHQSGFSGGSTTGNTGFAGRAFAGYQFNPNWGIETGWTQFHNMTTRYSATSGGVTGTANGTLKTNAVDLVAKGTMPLQNGFSVFGKLGAAYLIERANVSVNVLGQTFSGSDSERKVFPTFGLGVGYDITPNLVTDLSWQRIQKVGNSDLASTDFVGVGLSYHFS